MKFYVWGNSPASSELIANAEASPEAAQTAITQGFAWKADSWAVEVEATEEEIDAATRFDSAVTGYCEAPAASWFAEFTRDDAAIHVAGIGYGEDMDGQPLELTPRQWNPKTGVLEFDDGRFIITVRFLPSGEVEFVGKN